MSLIGNAKPPPVARNEAPAAPPQSNMQEWMAARRAEATGEGTGDTSAAGLSIHRNFATQGFIDAGKAGKDWFKIPEEYRTKFLQYAADAGSEGPGILAALDRACQRLNEFMAREDIDDGAKLAMLRALMSHETEDYDDDPSAAGSDGFGTNHTRLGTVLAELMSGNGKVLFNMDDLEVDSASAMATDLEHALTVWMKDNEVSVKPDTSAAYFKGLQVDAEANRKRRENMTPEERIADIEATNHRRGAGIREKASGDAANIRRSQVPA